MRRGAGMMRVAPDPAIWNQTRGTPYNGGVFAGSGVTRECQIRFLGFKGSSWAAEKGHGARLGLLPIVRRLTPFTDRIALTFELAGLRAAEITFALKVIDERWEVTPHKPIAGAGHARGR